MRILVVEDDFDALDVLQVMLRLEGHDVVTAVNGEDGWNKYKSGETVSVVISDWLMPETDGLELCRRIRSIDSSRYCYVILLSALQGKPHYLEALGAGADDFISKPYDKDELRARLLVAERIVGLHARIKHLEGILPTCMYCKRIRDEHDKWVHIEYYISQRTEAHFSHGVCPQCYRDVVQPDLDAARPR